MSDKFVTIAGGLFALLLLCVTLYTLATHGITIIGLCVLAINAYVVYVSIKRFKQMVDTKPIP